MNQLKLMRFWIRERPAGSKDPTHWAVLGGQNNCAQVEFPGKHSKETAEFMRDAFNDAADKVEAREVSNDRRRRKDHTLG